MDQSQNFGKYQRFCMVTVEMLHLFFSKMVNQLTFSVNVHIFHTFQTLVCRESLSFAGSSQNPNLGRGRIQFFCMYVNGTYQFGKKDLPCVLSNDIPENEETSIYLNIPQVENRTGDANGNKKTTKTHNSKARLTKTPFHFRCCVSL